VTVMGGDEGAGENIIHVDEGVKGRGVERVKKGVHGGVGYGGDVVPAKGGACKADIEDGVVGGNNREDEGVGKSGGEDKRPVEVCNVGSVEEDEVVGSKGRFEGVKVGESVVFGKVGVVGVGKPAIEDSTNLGGVIFGLGNNFSSGWQVGGLSTVEL
jgi:hypothetical protein